MSARLCENYPPAGSCSRHSDDVETWCASCLRDHVDRLRPIEAAAEKLILARRGWQRWGGGHFLYDRTEGFGEGRVYEMTDALDRLAREIRARRRR